MTDYHSDFNITPATEVDELVEYAKEQSKDPVTIQGTTVYNYSTHEVDKEALNNAIQRKLQRDLYVIPMQIQTGWMFVQSILPDRLKSAEVLMYRPDEEEYYAYHNYVRDMPMESRYSERQEVAEVIRNHE